MKRTDIINAFIKHFQYSRYLEIGVNVCDHNFNHIICDEKTGVDPNGCTTFTMTSDEFFERNNEEFDIIFIDGLHTEEQVDKDIANSLKSLSRNGSIILHDCLPATEHAQRDVYDGVGDWNGTVWRSVAKLRLSRTDLSINTIDTDYGCGVIRFGNSTIFPASLNELTYEFFASNKNELMNIVSPSQLENLLVSFGR